MEGTTRQKYQRKLEVGAAEMGNDEFCGTKQPSWREGSAEVDSVRADVVRSKWLANLLTDGPLQRLYPVNAPDHFL